MTMALLVVDMQVGVLTGDDGGSSAFDLAGVIERINRLAQRARAAGAPVIWVQHEADGTALAHGSPGWQLDPRLLVDARDLHVHKRSSAPYASSPLQSLIDERGIRQLAIAGCASEFCVDSTVRWSASLGYAVSLVCDAHTTHDKPHLGAAQIVAHHNATLPAMRSLGAPIAAVPAAGLWADAPAAQRAATARPVSASP